MKGVLVLSFCYKAISHTYLQSQVAIFTVNMCRTLQVVCLYVFSHGGHAILFDVVAHRIRFALLYFISPVI